MFLRWSVDPFILKTYNYSAINDQVLVKNGVLQNFNFISVFAKFKYVLLTKYTCQKIIFWPNWKSLVFIAPSEGYPTVYTTLSFHRKLSDIVILIMREKKSFIFYSCRILKLYKNKSRIFLDSPWTRHGLVLYSESCPHGKISPSNTRK